MGQALMEKLIAYAKAKGMKELHGHIPAEKTMMLKVSWEFGFAVRADPDDLDTLVTRLDLTMAGDYHSLRKPGWSVSHGAWRQ